MPSDIAFPRARRMRMGRRPRIAVENLSDPCLITPGNDVVIGGSAEVHYHHGGVGRPVIAPVEIGGCATIGQEATLVGDVVIGQGATVLAQPVLMPGTRIGPGEIRGGVPARPIPFGERRTYQASIRARPGSPAASARGGRCAQATP